MEKKKAIKLALFLAIISALAGVVIGGVNMITEPVIQANLISAEKANLEQMYPGSDFTMVEYSDEEGLIEGVYQTSSGAYIFKATATGFNSSVPIIVLVGIENDSVAKIQVLQQQETNGFGSKVFEEDWLNSNFVGKSDASQIDSLSGATYTSSAMSKIMSAVFNAYGALKG